MTLPLRVDIATARAAIRKGIDQGLTDDALLDLPILSPLPRRTRRRHIRWVRRQAYLDALPPGVQARPEYVPLFPDPETGVMSKAGHVLSAIALLGVFAVAALSCRPAERFAERRIISHVYGPEKYDAGLRINGRVKNAPRRFNVRFGLSDGRLMPVWASNVYSLSVPALVFATVAAYLTLWWSVWGGRDGRGGWRDLWERCRPPRHE